MIDRISPTKRPDRAVAGYQSWRSLLFMHWPVPIDELRPLVPDSLEIDTHEGVAYVGLVPFAMQYVRPRWAPKLIGFNFLETNVRTYVTHGNQPGVYFFSLDAASRIGVWTARTFWGLPYYYSQMSLKPDGKTIHYQSCRNENQERLNVRCELGEALPPSDPNSLEFFFLERYLLFLEQKKKLYCGQVYHTPYPAQFAEILELDDQLLPAAGFANCNGMPTHTHFSAGVDVEIFSLQQVAG